MPDEDGFNYSRDALRQVSGALRRGADQLDEASAPELTAPDAGASSAVAGKAISDLLRSAIIGAQVLDEMAGKVHVANGSYDDVENSTEGQFTLNENRGVWNASRR